ncbi:MAG: hypothetical protein JW837_05105 [Sedimentisphaerales bacterium]|nr:hypothetical protein [Sedimentisphaerales bacterium]
MTMEQVVLEWGIAGKRRRIQDTRGKTKDTRQKTQDSKERLAKGRGTREDGRLTIHNRCKSKDGLDY